MMMTTIEQQTESCPACEGKRGRRALVCGPGFSRAIWHGCSVCHESGEVAAEVADTYRWLHKRGETLRLSRIARHLNGRSEAERLGVDPMLLNKAEQGDEAALNAVDARVAFLAGETARTPEEEAEG
jgi:hypothetical protein